MIFFLVLLAGMFLALVVQHFVGPIPPVGARVLLMHIVMFYGAVALPLGGMLALAFAGGLMWDMVSTQWSASPAEGSEGHVEIAMGWSIVLYAALGSIMNGFRPLFLRGRWEIHCLLTGVCTSLIVLAEYLMICLRRQPVAFVFDTEIWSRIGGAGIVATLLAPFFFLALNYLGALVGYDPKPERKGKN